MSGAEIMEWDHLPCPDCRKTDMGECEFQSEDLPHGYAVVCNACGFHLAGGNRDMVLAAVRVLVRWRLA